MGLAVCVVISIYTLFVTTNMALTLMSRKFYTFLYKYIKFIDAVLKYKLSVHDVCDIYLSTPTAIHKQKICLSDVFRSYLNFRLLWRSCLFTIIHLYERWFYAYNGLFYWVNKLLVVSTSIFWNKTYFSMNNNGATFWCIDSFVILYTFMATC